MSNTIQEDYVSFETAKLLKEKGFDEPCMYYSTEEAVYIRKPTQALAIKWLRIKHNIHISIQTIGNEHDYPRYMYQVCNLKDWKCSIHNALKELEIEYEDLVRESHPYPEEAIEQSLQYCLKHLI